MVSERAFDIAGPPRIVFGAGAEGRTADLLAELGAERVLLVAMERFAGGAERIHRALGDRSVGVWTGALPQVPRATADALVQRVRETHADWVVAHGGGTAIGAAKAAALQADVRVGAVPTTYSGSEMTPIWGITTDEIKTTGRDERVRPQLVVYDPDLYADLPGQVTRTSLYNALAHSIDGLFDGNADASVLDDAEASVVAIVAALRDLASEPHSKSARTDAVYGAYLAGKVLGTATIALHHKLAHVLGGSFGLPHAATHAALLPYTLAYNQKASEPALTRLRRALAHPDPAAAIYDLSKQLGIETRLSELGFGRHDIERAVQQSVASPYANPRPVTAPGLTSLLQDAIHDRRPSMRTSRVPLHTVGPHAGIAASLRGPPLDRAKGVVMAVHGRGSNADAFVERLAAHVGPHVAILAPQADRCTWYPKSFRDVDANRDHLQSALATLDATFELAAAHVGARRVAVVGFSQGACLAATWLQARAGRGRPHSAAFWSGASIPGFGPFHDLEAMPIYVGASTGDRWVDEVEVRAMVAALEAAGADVRLHIARSSEHAVRPADVEGLRSLLEITMNTDELAYQTGFGNALASEARQGALPKLQNGPQQVPYGLYAEQINGTGFTVQRAHNHRVWLYRLRPQIALTEWARIDSGRFVGRFDEGVVSPQILRYAPSPFPPAGVDFIAGMSTFAGAGDPNTKAGFAIHTYAATSDMERSFTDIDGDLLVVPQDGALSIQTELGWLHVAPGEIAILPRGIRFRVQLPDGRARGFVGELFNGHYQLPERGPIGANGLADERHFKAPVASFEDVEGPHQVVTKQGGDLWTATLAASPFDVVAWHGSYAPFKYDLMHFNAYWGANWDHPDPSILTVLTAAHDEHGRNAVDFAVFKGRWDTIEHSFRPPFFHRNSAIEFNAVIQSTSTAGPYQAGAVTYTPYLSPHGVGVGSYKRAVQRPAAANDQPVRLPDDELWIQFESTYPLRVMPWALDAPHRDRDYLKQFEGYPAAKVGDSDAKQGS